MKLVILGGSGAGKSTQAQRICEHLHIPLISTGAILREEIANNSPLGRNTQSYLQIGDLAPDEIMIECIRQKLVQPNFQDGWVLEGYPRTPFQAEELDFLLDDCQQKLDWAIYLQVPEAVMVNRSLSRCLEDDQPEIVQRRIELFYDRTIPILEYYDRSRRLLTINGDLSPEAVLQEIINLLCIANS